MELRQLRYALSVAKERSFTRAATRLNVSQSAVSEQVSLLEREIGFPLFRRTSRGIELTERGRTFLYDAERVIGDVLSLSDTARRLRGAPSDTLTLGMGSGMAQIFMPRLFQDVQKALPGARLEIVTAAPDHKRSRSRMTGIQHAAELFGIPQECVGFVDDQRRSPLLHGTEQGRGRDVRRR